MLIFLSNPLYFTVGAILGLGFTALIWSRDDIWNVLIKAAFSALTLWGLFLLLVLDGYVVRA